MEAWETILGLGTNVCVGATISPLTISYINGSGTPQYQWYSNTISSSTGGTLITGATNNTYTPTTITAVLLYYFERIKVVFLSRLCL